MTRIPSIARGVGATVLLLLQIATTHAQQVSQPLSNTRAQPTPAAAQPVTSPPTPAAAPQASPTSVSTPAGSEDIPRPSPTGALSDLSPLSMFMSADWLVKVVIVTLVLASLATWTILFAKTVQLLRAGRQLSAGLHRIADSRTLGEAQMALGSADSVVASLVSAARQEIQMSGDAGSESGLKERAASRFSEIAKLEARAIRYGMGLVATVGATAPFVGLFGTVWGIMNSFIGISKAQTTNLAVVAPGIAEALLATAVGLGAAIPAVIIYNYFSRATKGYLDLVGRGTGAVGRLLSRDIDRFQARAVSRAAE